MEPEPRPGETQGPMPEGDQPDIRSFARSLGERATAPQTDEEDSTGPHKARLRDVYNGPILPGEDPDETVYVWDI